MNMLQLFASALALICTVTIASAQRDVRLSPMTPSSYDMPADLRIQAAARNGRHGLAVWGACWKEVDDSISGVLVMQSLRDGAATGEPVRLTEVGARPFGAVGVIAVDGGFVVVWNDRRADRQGINRAFVDSNGGVIHSSQSISVTTNAHERFIVVGTPGLGHALIWQSADQAVYVQRFDSVGSLLGSASRLATGGSVLVLHVDMPGGSTLLRVGATSTYLIGDDGRFDGREIPHGRFDRPFRVEPDGTLFTIDSNRLTRYSSIFDSLPSSSTHVPLLDSVRRGSVSIRRDPQGRIALLHLRRTAANDTLRAWLEESTIDSSGNLANRRTVDVGVHRMNLYNPYDQLFHVGDSVGGLGGSDNGRTVTMTVWMSWSRYHPSGFYKTTYRYSYSLIGDSVRAGVVAIDTAHRPDSELRARRISFDTTSTIEVDPPSARLSIAIPPKRLSRPHRSPGVLVDDGHLLVTWNQPNDVRQFVMGTLWRTPPYFRPLDSLHIEPVRYYDSVKIDPLGRVWQRVYRIYYQSAYLSHWDNTTVVGSDAYLGIEETTAFMIESFRMTLWRATALGWRSWSRRYEQVYHPFTTKYGWTFEPDSNRLLVYVDTDLRPPEVHRTDFFLLDRRGSPTGALNMPVTTHKGEPLAVDDTTMLLVSGGVARRFERGRQVDSFDAGYGEFHRLRGRRLLRINRGGGWVDLAVFDLDGRSSPRVGIPIASANGEVSHVENPSDRSIALLYVAADGRVHATIVRRDLSIRIADTAISSLESIASTPIGAFRGDTLYVVWEEMRDGEPAVYTSSFVPTGAIEADVAMPTMTGQLADHDGGAIENVSPNPAAEMVRLSFSAIVARGSEVSIIDVNGQVVYTVTLALETSTISIPTGAFPSGAYVVTLRSGSSIDHARLNIVHH